MNDLNDLWLQMLMLFAVINTVDRARAGWHFHWGLVLQQVLLVAIAAYGLFVGASGTCAALGWGLWLLLTLLPPRLMGRVTRHLSLMDTMDAREDANRLRLFFWGPPGRFWADNVTAMELALEERHSEARALMAGYLRPGIPAQYRSGALGAIEALRVVARDWDGVIADFEHRVPQDGSAVSATVADVTVRAYLERGRLAEAVQLLARTRTQGGRRAARAVKMQAIAFYALTGSPVDLERELAEAALPDYAADSWRVRCLAAMGRDFEARTLYERMQANLPDDRNYLRARLGAMGSEMASWPVVADDPVRERAVAFARGIFESELHSASILGPGRSSVAVTAVVGAIALAFVPAHLYQLVPTDYRLLSIADWILAQGQLSASALTGEPWRFFSYMFLHADIFHVGLNLLVLWMFGRQAEALFGPWFFLVIFFVTGALGGLAQLELAPGTQTIGASGAVLGVFGAVIAGLARSRGTLSDAVRKDQVRRLLSVAVFQFVLDQAFSGHVAVYVHAAGMLSGGAIGLVAPLARPRAAARRADARPVS